MNARFEDLMYRAGLTAQGCWDEMDEYDRKAIEKLAELIIQECGIVGDDWVYYEDNGKNLVSERLNHHFGIGK